MSLFRIFLGVNIFCMRTALSMLFHLMLWQAWLPWGTTGKLPFLS